MIDYEKLRERLSKKLDIALEIAKVRQEVWDALTLEKDDSRSWDEIDFAKSFLLFECANYIDKLIKNESQR